MDIIIMPKKYRLEFQNFCIFAIFHHNFSKNFEIRNVRSVTQNQLILDSFLRLSSSYYGKNLLLITRSVVDSQKYVMISSITFIYWPVNRFWQCDPVTFHIFLFSFHPNSIWLSKRILKSEILTHTPPPLSPRAGVKLSILSDMGSNQT